MSWSQTDTMHSLLHVIIQQHDYSTFAIWIGKLLPQSSRLTLGLMAFNHVTDNSRTDNKRNRLLNASLRIEFNYKDGKIKQQPVNIGNSRTPNEINVYSSDRRISEKIKLPNSYSQIFCIYNGNNKSGQSVTRDIEITFHTK